VRSASTYAKAACLGRWARCGPAAVLSGRPDQALTWADRAVSGTVPGSVLRAMARTAQAYAFAAASSSPEGWPRSASCPSPPDRGRPGGVRRVFLVVALVAAYLPASIKGFAPYLPSNGAGPSGAGKLFGGHQLGPWTGFAVLCGYAVVLTGLAAWQLRRRDA